MNEPGNKEISRKKIFLISRKNKKNQAKRI